MCFYFKNDLIKKFECLPSLSQDVLTLANIDLNNNASGTDSNIDESKEEKLRFSLNTDSVGEANEEDDSNSSMKMASNEPNFKVVYTRYKIQKLYFW